MSDVIIIGGGPGGSALGCYLSMAGITNTIIEKAIHPRPHVGESMVTSSTRVFEEIGFLPILEREGFVHKYGASWHASRNQHVFSIEFSEFPQEGIDQDYTYHVDRAQMDLLLLKRAEELGSKIIQGVGVKKVLFNENQQATGVQIDVEGQMVELNAKVVVDASGRNTVLGRQLKIKKNDPLFNQYAVHAWFENLDRSDETTGDHIHIYFLETERGWVWQIPITEGITSVGVVVDKKVFKDLYADTEQYFWDQVKTNDNLQMTMKNARRINEFKAEGDYSYSMSQFVGDGWLLVGDAARFVDPIFSSGVSIALYSAKFASERIIEAFEKSDFSKAVFEPYETKLRAGAEIWYQFILLYYKLLPSFTWFIREPKHRLGVLRLLQGEVFDRDEVPVLDEMRKFIEMVENQDNHIFKEQLSELPTDLKDVLQLEPAAD